MEEQTFHVAPLSKFFRKISTKRYFYPLVVLALLVVPLIAVASDKDRQTLFSQAASVSYTTGVTSIGSRMDSGNNNWISSTQVTTGPNSGILASISVYIGNVNGSPSNHMQAAIYTDNGNNAPGALIGTSGSQVLQAKAWNVFPINNVAITSNTKYWLAFNVDGSKTQYAIASNSPTRSAWRSNIKFGTWANPFGTTALKSTEQYSIYMIYNSVPSVTATPMPTLTLPTQAPIISPTAMPTVTPTIVPGQPTPTPIQQTGSRDPLKQPFASTSIWNMPIGSGAIYVAANMPANPGSDQWTPMPQIDDEHIVLRSTAPLTAINYSDAAWSGKNRCSATGGLLVSVPIPSNYLVPHDNTNSAAVFLMPDGRTIIQTQPLARCTAGGPGTSVIKFNPVDLYGDGILGAHGGSKLSAIGGSIRVGELRPGGQAPLHALKLNVDSQRVLYNCKTDAECFRWPATAADSGAVGDYGSRNPAPNPAMKMGALLAIPASVTIASLGLESDPGKQVAWTLQNYGVYIVDSTGGPAYAFSAENGPDGSMRTQFKADYGYDLEQRINNNTAWSRDIQRLMTALYVVNNNTATSIGGGGTPLQPLAPPIAP